MRKFVIVGSLLLAVLIALGLFFTFKTDSPIPLTSQNTNMESKKPTISTTKAKFLIYTNGTRRDFSDSRYHNLTSSLYIDPLTPYEVVSIRSVSTWDDFFKTLPMKVEKDCLSTGTGQVFCSNETESLKFYVNGKFDPNTLTRKIDDGDMLLISFGSEGKEGIDFQLKELSKL